MKERHFSKTVSQPKAPISATTTWERPRYKSCCNKAPRSVTQMVTNGHVVHFQNLLKRKALLAVVLSYPKPCFSERIQLRGAKVERYKNRAVTSPPLLWLAIANEYIKLSETGWYTVSRHSPKQVATSQPFFFIVGKSCGNAWIRGELPSYT